MLDEVGFQAPERGEAACLCEISNKRYTATKRIIITNNKSYGQWHAVFPAAISVVAILDRLLHHAVTVDIRGDSYRLQHRKATLRLGRSPQEEAMT